MLKEFYVYNINRCLTIEGEKLKSQYNVPNVLIKPLAVLDCARKGLIQIPHIDLMITTRCSLDCKYCTQWNPWIKEKKTYSAKEVISDMKKLLTRVNYIHSVAVLGGEPFVNKECDAIVAWLLKQKKIGKVVVITNGTIFPKEDVLLALKNKKAELWIDKYGECSKQAFKLRRFCERNNIAYRYEPIRVWKDLGYLRGKILDNYADIKKLWDWCWLKYCTCYVEGKIYRCVRTWVLEKNGLEKPRSNEVMDIKKIRNRKQMLKEFYQFYTVDYLNACAWCNSCEQIKNIKPAEQI